jgi:cytoskeletal protein RodZ
MSYNDNRNRVGDETSYTGWIIGGIVALAVIVAIFAFSHNTGDTNSANNTPSTSSGTTPSTTGSGTNSPATSTPAAPRTAPAR